MTGHFPPSSRIQGVKFLAASMATSLPVKDEPVKQMQSKGRDDSFLAISTFPSIHLKYSRVIEIFTWVQSFV